MAIEGNQNSDRVYKALLQAAEQAKHLWTRVYYNSALGSYEVLKAPAITANHSGRTGLSAICSNSRSAATWSTSPIIL